MKPTPEQRVLTGGEAAKYLRVGERTLRRHVEAGRIPCWVDADTGRRRYPKAALDAFLASFATEVSR